jgi:hypothetical protein
MVRIGITRNAWLVIVLMVAACGARGPTPSPTGPPSLNYAQRAGARIIEADTHGGLLPPGLGKHVAQLTIYGDGLVILGGEETFGGGTDHVVMIGHIGEEELKGLLRRIAELGFFQLEERYQPSPAPTDLPSRWITVNLLQVSKTVTVYPSSYDGAPGAFLNTYDELLAVRPGDTEVFRPASGILTASDLGPIDDLRAGQRNQVAPWDTPLVGIDVADATKGAHLEGEQYQTVEEFLLRYPPNQLFGSQEGRAYEVCLEARLPWEIASP